MLTKDRDVPLVPVLALLIPETERREGPGSRRE